MGRTRKYEDVDAEAVMQEQIKKACSLFGSPYNSLLPDDEPRRSLREVANIMNLSVVKVRRLLIAGNHYMTPLIGRIQELTNHGHSIETIAEMLGMEIQSVRCYMPYESNAYGLGTAGAKKQKAVRERRAKREERDTAVRELRDGMTEDTLWKCIVAYQGYEFNTVSGLPFSYELKRKSKGILTGTPCDGNMNKSASEAKSEYTKELWISRRTDSKPLTISTLLLALEKVKENPNQFYRGPKDFMKIRGISYIYAMFLEWGLVKDMKMLDSMTDEEIEAWNQRVASKSSTHPPKRNGANLQNMKNVND